MNVYFDVLYKTWAFRPILATTKSSLKGRLRSASGKSVAWKKVVLRVKDISFFSFTNARGEFSFHGAPSTAARLQVGNVTKTLPRLPARQAVDIVLP
jgi:hypothetical protein